MNVFPRSLGFTLLSAVAVIAGLSAEVSDVFSQEKANSVAMHPNYRALIARQVLQLGLDRKTLRTAMISRPFGKSGGWFVGGTIPTVCVSIETENMLGNQFRGYFLFTVRNGQAERLNVGNAIIDDCPGLSPFHEVRSL